MDFAALGKGPDRAYWAEFLAALKDIDPEMWITIEHEDVKLGRIEGLQVAANVLKAVNAAETK